MEEALACFIVFCVCLYILIATFFSDKQKQKKEIEHLFNCINEHVDTLYVKWKQKVYKDDYGRDIFDDWHKEIKYFIQNIVFPNTELDEIALLKKTKQFIEYWAFIVFCRLDDKSDWKYEFEVSKQKIKTGIEYEYYVENILRAMGYNIQRTAKTGDQGVDLIVEQNEIKMAIQCKFYQRPVGNKAVQEVIAGQIFYNCNCAAVISNSTFTKSAKQLAKNSNVILLTIDCNS